MVTNRRNKYTREFKEEAVNLITELGYSLSETAKNLEIHPNLLCRWKREFSEETQEENYPTDKASLHMEVNRLRLENKQLRMEREILKKAAAFFAKEQK
jgi:transposase